MIKHTSTPIKVLSFGLLTLITFSCSKDSDLLADYVLSETPDVIAGTQFVLDDTFDIKPDSATKLDVLENDRFNEQDIVKIIEISSAAKGDVVINPDNTLTYTPDKIEETIDTFTYTIELENPDKTVTTETGTVTVNITDTSANNNRGINLSINNQAVFTASMAIAIKNRIDNGWAHPGSGFPDDEAYIISQKNAFDANVNIGQWDNFNLDDGAAQNDAPAPAYGVTDEIHYAAIYAFLYNDDALAQKVVDRIITYANDPDLDIAQNVRDNGFNTTNTLTSPWLFMAPKMVKLMESYALCKNLVTITQIEDDEVGQWFLDWRNLFYDAANFSLEVTWGNGWKSDNYTTTGYNFENGRTNPAFTDVSSGSTAGEYIVAQSQETGLNNIRCEMWAYVHAYGTYYNHVQSKEDSFSFFKTWLRFNFYADGTSAELVRATASNPQLGIGYTSASITAMAKAAMTQKIAASNGLTGIGNGNEWLDYSTSEGTEDFAGTTNHIGTSTSGGTKSILTVTKAHLNFMRQYGAQGWSPQRYFNGNVLMDGDTKMHHRPAAAILNIHYQDAELEAGWKNDPAYGYAVPISNSDNKGTHGVLYGLMYWAGL